MTRKPTKFTGVYSIESAVKKFDGKPDLCFYITYKSPNGKKIWEKLGWRSEKMTAALASAIRGERLQQVRLGSSETVKSREINKNRGMTFGEAWAIFDEKWLPNIKNPNDERNRYKRYIKEKFEFRPLQDITILELEEFKTTFIQRGFAAATIRLVMGDIRRVYNKMEEWGLYSGPMPASKIKTPKVDNARARFLTADEAQTLLAALQKRSPLWHDIAMVSLHTGMRLSEVLTLRRQDIDLHNKIIHLDGKTGKRSAPMNEKVFVTLQAALASHKMPLVFPGKNGQQIRPDSATNSYAEAVKDAKLNPVGIDRRYKVVFHTLRHTYCSWLAMAGVPLYVIGEMVGHSSPQMTKRYSHLCPDKKHQTVSLIDQVFSSGTASQTERYDASEQSA